MEEKKNLIWKESYAKKLIIPILIIWVALAIVFTFTDLQISIAIVDENSVWAEFIADYGEWPGWVVFFTSLFILYGSIKRLGKKKYLIIVIGILIAISLLIFLYYEVIKEFIDIGNELAVFEPIMIPIIGVVLGLIFYKIFDKLSPEKFQPYVKFSQVIFLLGLINPIILVQIIKLLWGRVRFRNLTPPGYPEFTPWYIPQGITGNQSFPSGHAAMGWMLLPLILLVIKKNKIIKYFIVLLVITWGILVALGRIVIGAHYASDTLFSTGIAVIIFIYLYKKFYFSSKSG